MMREDFQIYFDIKSKNVKIEIKILAFVKKLYKINIER